VSQTPDPTPPTSPRELDELWRRALGRQLRALRLARGERLDDTALRAGISPQYLSEVERGRKDPSSEMIGAVIGALESTLAEVLAVVARELDARMDARYANVIDIRSATRLADRGTPHSPGTDTSSGARLLVAA
jgi:transcriptional regulator with XRE-family HTH domain